MNLIYMLLCPAVKAQIKWNEVRTIWTILMVKIYFEKLLHVGDRQCVLKTFLINYPNDP